MRQMEDTDAVRRIMSAAVVRFSPDDSILDAIDAMVHRNVVGGAVVDERGNVVGVLTQKECIDVVYRAAYYDQWSGRVGDYMNTEIAPIDANRHIIELPGMIAKAPNPLYPVVEEGRLVGQVTMRDILKTLLAFANQRGWRVSS